MEQAIRKIVVVGGGTAGWLSACLIAARGGTVSGAPIEVTLIESPDIPTIGVGEGTWPTMRHTLERIGVSEADFLVACDAAFKQGSRFDGWRDGRAEDHYFHPFTPPADGDARSLIAACRNDAAGRPFAEGASPQPGACLLDLAPRQRAMPDYAGALNYAYHLDAGKFAAFLARHATERLGVRHVRDHVVAVERAADGDIAGVRTRAVGSITGDLFIDCTGHAALLIGGEYGVPLVDCGATLFNDTALAVQVPVEPGSAIASQTNATAHEAGWIWDIGLPTRRGIGCVYSSAHMDDDAAAKVLRDYLRRHFPGIDPDAFPPRRLAFRSGHRERFWERNCLAVGLSAGFLEPLEASAIVLIELSVDALLDGWPATRAVMDLHAKRFNALFEYRWGRIVEFLKLHYVLSTRDEPYWRAHRDPATIPPRLTELLSIWRHQPPSRADFPAIDEVFPAASYLYVLYGMGYPLPPATASSSAAIPRTLDQVGARVRALTASLPANRAYLDALHAQHGLAAAQGIAE